MSTVLPIDRRAAVDHLMVRDDSIARAIASEWATTGHTDLLLGSNPILHDRLVRLAAAFAAHRQAGEHNAREAACAILKSAEPNTDAERIVAAIDQDFGDELPDELDKLIRDWANATARELADLQREIRLHVGTDAMERSEAVTNETATLRAELAIAVGAAEQKDALIAQLRAEVEQAKALAMDVAKAGGA